MFRFYLLIKCSRGLGLALAIALVSRWVCAAMACAKCAGKSKHNLLKNAKGRLYYFLVCPRLIFQSQSYLRSRSLVHVGNFCLKIVFRCFLKHKFVRALLLPTTCVYGGCGFRSHDKSPWANEITKTKLQTNTRARSLHKHAVLVAQLL